MLQTAGTWIDDDRDISGAIDAATPSRPITSSSSAPAPASARYGQRSRPNLIAIAFIVIFHVLLIAVLIQARTYAAKVREEKLTVVNLSPPPPPPAAETPPPPPSAPQVVAPPPIVQTPAPPVPVQTTPEPVPVAAVTAPAPPSPAPPAAVFAPPAPPSIVQAGDIGTQMVSGKPPRYPIESRRKHEQGTVVLSLVVGLDGSIERISIAHSSGSSRLDDAARDAVKSWRWRPIIRGGQAVRVQGIVEIPFVLRTDAA
jgi:protein TonB